MTAFRRNSCLLIFFLLAGCGYRLQDTSPRQLSVPFVEGDRSGLLTQLLIHQLSLRPSLSYTSSPCGDYLLRVRLLELDEENIGFRYERHKKCERDHSIIPTEMRLTLAAEVSLIHTITGKELIEKRCVEASVEFDHDYYSSCGAINLFSLGQLADIDAAREAAMRPLYRTLAERIADLIDLCYSHESSRL